MEGLATSDALDLDGQIIDKDFARNGLEKWFSDWGNVRQMHSSNLPPAGKAVEFSEVPGGFWVKSLVVEPTAQKLVREGVYSAYSVGIAKPRIVRDNIAKNGRVVGGIFSEISLVDFPANPQCKFNMAKMAATGIEILDKVEQPDLVKRDFDKNTGGGVDRDKVSDEDFAGPHRSFPIVTPGDVSDAAHLVGKADDPAAVKAKIISIAHRKGAKFVAELPDSWKSDAAKDLDPEVEKKRGEWKDGKKPFAGAAAPFKKDDGDDDGDEGDDDEADEAKAEKRKDAEAHLEHHPEPDGDEHGPDLDRDEGDGGDATGVHVKGFGELPAVPYHLKRLHDGLCPAYSADDVLIEHPSLVRGVGTMAAPEWFAQKIADAVAEQDASALAKLGPVYGAALAVQTLDRDLTDVALDHMRKAFAEYYPDAHPTPTDMEPGKFDRGFIGTGRAKETPGTGPRIPLASHTPDPADFHRGSLTDGREAVSKQRTFYTNEAKAQAAQSASALHDYIVSQHPEVCPIHGVTPDGEPALVSSAGSSLTVTKPVPDTLPNRADSQLRPVSEPQLAGVHAGVDAELVKHLVAEATREATEPLRAEIATLRKEIETYEAAPDPAAAAPRHATAVTAPVPEVATGGDEAPDPGQVAELVRLVAKARHRDSEVSRPAYDKLIRKFGPQAAAELI